MPYALVIIGLLMIITGVLNTYAAFASQLQSDFTGPGNFVFWVIALGSVGALGYVDSLRTFSHYFMALILIALILNNKGVFANFQKAIQSGPIAPTIEGQPQTSLSSASSTSELGSAITSNQQGVGGSTPANAGQAKFNGWMNYIFGLGTNSGVKP